MIFVPKILNMSVGGIIKSEMLEIYSLCSDTQFKS